MAYTYVYTHNKNENHANENKGINCIFSEFLGGLSSHKTFVKEKNRFFFFLFLPALR